ncbi:hypothetical protein [Sinorhizobium meliloti]|uniref:hypothetical protein n=1 Tax=Rhizobium meliloti TaxID=382 RepID=UPI000FDA054F|nr:hypothetical protein [Sinorhizobium meliloti]RVP80427.1 hypothetical protein CN096_38025 [Sinorhizobium meliloti]
MAKVIKTTKRKRGVFGTIVWWLFLAFNGLMALWVFWAIKMQPSTPKPQPMPLCRPDRSSAAQLRQAFS